MIKNKDRKYCYECTYIIGVITHDKSTEYNLLVEKLDANFTNSLFLRVGESYTSKLAKGEKKIFKFLIDEKTKVNLQHTTKKGNVRIEWSNTLN